MKWTPGNIFLLGRDEKGYLLLNEKKVAVNINGRLHFSLSKRHFLWPIVLYKKEAK